MSKHFEVGTPMSLGHRRATVNQDEKAAASLERIAGKVAELLAPGIAEAVAQQMKEAGIEPQGPTANGSNGRRMPPQDQWDTLPPGDDHWAGVDLNDAIDPPKGRKPGPLDEYDFPDELRGDDFANLPD